MSVPIFTPFETVNGQPFQASPPVSVNTEPTLVLTFRTHYVLVLTVRWVTLIVFALGRERGGRVIISVETRLFV